MRKKKKNMSDTIKGYLVFVSSHQVVEIKWGSKIHKDIFINLNEHPNVFRAQLYVTCVDINLTQDTN